MPTTTTQSQMLVDFATTHSPVIFYIAEAKKGWPLIFISENIKTITGHRSSSLLRKPDGIVKYIHPDDRSGSRPTLKKLREDGAHAAEFRFATASGDYHWIRESARLKKENGREQIVGCLVDVTAAKGKSMSRSGDELVRSVLEACPVPVRMTRLHDGEILYESPSSKAAYGGSPDMVIEHYVDPSDRDHYVKALKKAGQVENYEVTFRRANGEQYLACVSAELIDYQGESVVVSTTIDLTEQRMRETELRNARELLEDAIESLSEGFAIWDAENRLVMCNSRYKDLSVVCADILAPGVTWEELIRTGAERGQFANAEGRVEEFVADWKRNRMRDHSGIEIQHTDGRWFTGSSYTTRQGGRVGVRIEITERKEMEEALRESENLVRRVLEASPVPITMNRVENGEILYQSPAAKELYESGKSQDQPAVLDRWADESQRKNYLDALIVTGAIDGWEIERIRYDGSKFWALESARLIDFQGEKVIVSSVLDLTERREKNAEIARQREALHQSEKLSALGELLAGVSHELNNPLSVLVGQAQLLKETMTDPDIVHRAEKISDAANRCARIVKSFLAMARQEPVESRPSDINDVVESAIELTAYALRSADIDVELNLASDLPPVMLDPDQFGQVVTNLIINAQHALEEVEHARSLKIETKHRRGRGSVVLTVTDNGPGIAEDIQKRIFEPLYTTKEFGAGTGMGLALCDRIVATHAGSLTVKSQLGKGACFIVGLPRSATDREVQAADAAMQRQDGQARVLVIDDEPEVAAVIAEIIRNDGHEVDIAHSGEQALKAIARTGFDIILCDLRMRHLDGPGLYKRLEKERPDLRDRIGFLTGDTLGQGAREFLRGVDCPFIEKPATAEEVRELVSGFLKNK